MVEKKIFQEIPKKAEFHSVVMTCFSFDFHHFESQVLKNLKSKGITNINVFVDHEMLDQSLGFVTGNIKSASKTYSVSSLMSKGVFHPKIILLVGENDVCLVQGSGNITNGGHGKNHELFNTLYASKEDKTQLPLITEAWRYIKQLTKNTSSFTLEKLNWVSSNCNLLKDKDIFEKHVFHNIDEDFSAALLYNEGNSSIWQQIINLIPKNVETVKVFSPFYDEKGKVLTNILEYFQPKELSVFLQKDKGFHPYQMLKDKRVKFLDWNSTKRSSFSLKHFERKLHSKIFVFKTKETEYCFLGSANASIQAFGDNKYRGANDEFGVLLKLKNRNIIKELNLDGNYKLLEPQNLTHTQDIEEESDSNETNDSSLKLRVLGADQNGKTITLFIENKNNLKRGHFNIYDNWGELVFSDTIELSNTKIRVELKDLKVLKNLAFVMFLSKDNVPISNKQMINSLHDLWNTNPSIENRKLLKLSSLIETGKNGIFDIINFFNTIETSRSQIKKNSSSNANQIKDDAIDITFSGMSYEEAILIGKDEKTLDKMALQHNTIKIWDAIESYFNELVVKSEDDEMDEEEEATAEKGRTRANNDKKKEPVRLNSKKVLEQRRSKIIKFLNNYINATDDSLDNDLHKVNIVDIAMYMVVLKHLLELVNKEVIIKNSDENLEDEILVVYDVLGGFNDLDNFSGGLIAVVGAFVNLIYDSPIHEPEDEFLLSKHKHYCNLARNTTLFSLAISMDVYKNHPNGAKWLDVIAFNILNKLGAPNEDLSKYFDSLILNTNMEDIKSSELISHANNWIKRFKANDWQKNYLIDDKLGVCDILKKIPKERPKFVKIARPGFSFEETAHDFVLNDLYNLETKELIGSLQENNKKL